MVEPIIKCNGNETIIIDMIREEIKYTKYTTWIDLFAGNLAMSLGIGPKKLIINDSNKVLIEIYNEIKEDPKNLIRELEEFSKIKYDDRKQYNMLEKSFNKSKEDEYTTRRGALFIYLNRHSNINSYNYKKKEFDGTFYKCESDIFTTDNIMALHRFFNERIVKFYHLDYSRFLSTLKDTDLVYINPPYYPISVIDLQRCNSNGFSVTEQKELCEFIKKLDARGIKFIMSNNGCNYIYELYLGFNIVKYDSGCKERNVSNTSKINECLIHNLESSELSTMYNMSTVRSKLDELETTIKKLESKKNETLKRYNTLIKECSEYRRVMRYNVNVNISLTDAQAFLKSIPRTRLIGYSDNTNADMNLYISNLCGTSRLCCRIDYRDGRIIGFMMKNSNEASDTFTICNINRDTNRPFECSVLYREIEKVLYQGYYILDENIEYESGIFNPVTFITPTILTIAKGSRVFNALNGDFNEIGLGLSRNVKNPGIDCEYLGAGTGGPESPISLVFHFTEKYFQLIIDCINDETLAKYWFDNDRSKEPGFSTLRES